MGTEQISSYRSIFKATSLFGGVRFYQIVIGIIRTKFVAVLLGPIGMGVQGLYLSALDLVKGVASMGLESSAVRDVSEANGSKNKERTGYIVSVLQKLVWITGIIGVVLVIVLSPFLSKWSFGNYEHIIPFIILSIILLIDQISAGQRVVLQGMRQLKYLAKSSAIGVTVGLVVSVPIYYLCGIKGIVPALILYSITSLILTWYFSRKVKVEKVYVSLKEAFKGGSVMLKMGLAMSFSSILAVAISYILRVYIRQSGGIVQVGLFTAGFTVISSYVGMIFNAMGTDYYPRLAAVNKDNEKCRIMVNQQFEIASLIMGPLLILCLLFMPFAIRLLYSEEFLPANDYVFWAVTGMFFRLASWTISYQFVAKGESRLYVINELAGKAVNLTCSLLGYRLGGLTGLGIGFTVAYFIYFIQVYLIAHKRYCFQFTLASIKTWGVQLIMIILCVAIVLLIEGFYRYLIGCVIICTSIVIALRGLDNRMKLLVMIKQRIHGRR